MKKNKKNQNSLQDKQYQMPTDAPFGEMKSQSGDPMGGYTGNPTDGGTPVQDADDL